MSFIGLLLLIVIFVSVAVSRFVILEIKAFVIKCKNATKTTNFNHYNQLATY